MAKNKITINGNNNATFQDVKKSDISIKNTNSAPTKEKSKINYALISIVIALIGLIVAVIVGWDTIVEFFN